MSSPPSPRTFEGWIVEDFGEAALTHPDVMALLEPYRERVDYLLDAFEEDCMSWRDYCGCIYGWSDREEGAVPHRVYEAALALARSPAPVVAEPSAEQRVIDAATEYTALSREGDTVGAHGARKRLFAAVDALGRVGRSSAQ